MLETKIMINIVIAGAGFGGLQTALALEKKFSAEGGSASGGKSDKHISITLIDKRDYHLFTPNLYEAATTEEELVSAAQVKASLTLPFSRIFKGKKVKFIKGELTNVDPEKKQLALGGKQISYDYLILALGSQSDFLKVEGAQKYALPLKSLPDALRIRNALEFAVQTHRMDTNKKTLRVVVAGGGYTGVEFAAELKGLMDFLAWKYQYPREKIEIEIVEANSKVVAGFDDRLSRDAVDRLRELGIRISLSSRISRVEQNFIWLMSGERTAYDVLVWTTGVRACPVACEKEIAVDRKGKISVNEFLQVAGHHNIFALGDVACVTDQKGLVAPNSAQDAWDQAKYLAYALPYITRNKKPPRPYIPKPHGFIVSVGGKWAIVCNRHFYFKGFFAYAVSQLAHLRYYISVVGVWKAIKFLVFQEEMYSRND